MFPEGGLAALTRLRGYVQERLAQLSRTGGATHIAEGRPYQEIVKLADTLNADLIVDRNRGSRIVIRKQSGVGIGD